MLDVRSDQTHAIPPRALLLGLSLITLAVCVASGVSLLDAPWIQGDEIIFIADNSDVTGAGRPEALWQRCIRIFSHTHEDLYQPFTILTYALEWAAWPPLWRVPGIRLTDVLIHCLNAILLWAALSRLLALFDVGAPIARLGVSWALSLLWAAHPMLVGAYAADMGRTHLLSSTFTLIALLFQLTALSTGRSGWQWAGLLALLLAMLNKPVVGWAVVILALEALRKGARVWREPHVYAAAGLCAFFAWLTLATTRGTLLLEDSPLPVFGAPLPRALLGLGVYLRNLAAPWGVTPWYPPDIHTDVSNPLAWLGATFCVVALFVLMWSLRWAETRVASLGIFWFFANWLPLSGFVTARVFAAQDRYMYLPLMGLCLSAATLFVSWIGRIQPVATLRVIAVGAAAMMAAALALPLNRELCETARSTLTRALATLSKNPNDPRVMEFVAVAYDFGNHRPTLEARLPAPPDFSAESLNALRLATQLAELGPQHFADANSRAAFHRRVSFVLWSNGLFELALGQALRASEFEPNARLTWLRLAHAYRALERFDEARATYERIEQLLTPASPDYALRLTEFGDLLLSRFEDAGAALTRFRSALATPQLDAQTRVLATLGQARCEVLAGQGIEGYRLASAILRVQPDNLGAKATIALYHLLSHQWEEAIVAYQEILAVLPNDYDSLRSLHEACARIGDWRRAIAAWESAIEVDPNQVIFRSYWVWALACGSDPEAIAWANRLLEVDTGNRFACLAQMLVAVRAGRVDEALRWIEASRAGRELPRARELLRAESTVGLLLERNELPSDAQVVLAALGAEVGRSDVARQMLDDYLRDPQAPAEEAARALLSRLPSSAPASQ